MHVAYGGEEDIGAVKGQSVGENVWKNVQKKDVPGVPSQLLRVAQQGETRDRKAPTQMSETLEPFREEPAGAPSAKTRSVLLLDVGLRAD